MTGARFIPVVRIDDTDEYIQDMTIIIDAIEKREPARPVMPTTPKQLLVSKLFELYADEWLVIPAMHYRWNKGQEHFIHGEFGDVVLPHWPGFLQRWVGGKLGSRFQGFVPKLGITEATIPAIEDWFERALLPALDAHFSRTSTLAQQRCRFVHWRLWVDGPILRSSMSRSKVRRTPGTNRTSRFCMGGAHEHDTNIYTAKLMEEWKLANPNAPIPRAIGTHSFQIGNATGERLVQSFSQWKLQRVLDDVYKGFDAADEKQQVDKWLVLSDTVKMGSISAFWIFPSTSERVTRENNRLVWETPSSSEVLRPRL